MLSSPYCISPLSSGVVYTFQVKTGLSVYCGTSHYWSDWSEQVQWIGHKDTSECGNINATTLRKVKFSFSNILFIVLSFLPFDVMDTAQPPVYWQVLGFVLGFIILISLSLLLCYSERYGRYADSHILRVLTCFLSLALVA